MNGSAYKFLGWAVWNAGKWYLRRRLPSPRKVALGLAGVGAVLAGAALLARRLAA